MARPCQHVDQSHGLVEDRTARHAFMDGSFPDLASGTQIQGVKLVRGAKRDIDQAVGYYRRGARGPELRQGIFGVEDPVFLARYSIEAPQGIWAAGDK